MTKPFRQANQSRSRGKKVEGGEEGAGGSHHGTSTIGLSCRRHLMQMRVHVNVKDRTMRVTQGCSHLRVLPMSGAVCQYHAPDLTGRSANDVGITHREDGDRKTKEAAQAHGGREDTDTCRKRGERERIGWRQTHTPSKNSDQR